MSFSMRGKKRRKTKGNAISLFLHTHTHAHSHTHTTSRFQVKRHPAGSRFRQWVDEVLRAGGHDVAVQIRVRNVGTKRLYHRRANGEVGNEVAVHEEYERGVCMEERRKMVRMLLRD